MPAALAAECVDFMCRVALDALSDLSQFPMWREKHMNMVCHDAPGVERVSLRRAEKDRVLDNLRGNGLFQIERSLRCRVEIAIGKEKYDFAFANSSFARRFPAARRLPA